MHRVGILAIWEATPSWLKEPVEVLEASKQDASCEAHKWGAGVGHVLPVGGSAADTEHDGEVIGPSWFGNISMSLPGKREGRVFFFKWMDVCVTCIPLLSLQTLENKPVYTEEELQRFEAELRDKEEELKRRAETLLQEQELLRERGKALEAQRREYQQVTILPWQSLSYIIWNLKNS